MIRGDIIGKMRTYSRKLKDFFKHDVLDARVICSGREKQFHMLTGCRSQKRHV